MPGLPNQVIKFFMPAQFSDPLICAGDTLVLRCRTAARCDPRNLRPGRRERTSCIVSLARRITDQSVPFARFREQKLRIFGVTLEFLAESGNVHVQHMRRCSLSASPHSVKQHAGRQEFVGVGRKQRENVSLSRSQHQSARHPLAPFAPEPGRAQQCAATQPGYVLTANSRASSHSRRRRA